MTNAVTIPAKGWAALEAAEGFWQQNGGVTVETALVALETQIDLGHYRMVGTNVVGKHVVISDGTITEQASYSIIEGGRSVLKDSVIVNSYVGFSTVEHSTVRDSHVSSSNITRNSAVRDFSDIDDSRVRDGSQVRRSSLSRTTLLEVTEVNDSNIRDLILNSVEIEGASLECGDKDFFDFGQEIGTGNHFYAYFNSDGRLVIQAGCQKFDSTREMMDYAKDAREYDGLEAPVKAA